jgi:hypothetical protein
MSIKLESYYRKFLLSKLKTNDIEKKYAELYDKIYISCLTKPPTQMETQMEGTSFIYWQENVAGKKKSDRFYLDQSSWREQMQSISSIKLY